MDGSGRVADDDDATHSTGTFPSDDDSANDIPVGEEIYFEYHNDPATALFALIEEDSPDLDSLHIYPYNPPLALPEWISLGKNIGSNTHLKRFNLCYDGLDSVEDEIASKENMEAFWTGFSSNRSLRLFSVEEDSFGRVFPLEILCPFLVENDNLTDIRLHSCDLGRHGMQMLSDAFSQRGNPTSIKRIFIGGEYVNDEQVPAIVDLCNFCPKLTQLDLSYSNIGNSSCGLLATLLQNRGSNLKNLDMRTFNIDDEGAQIFANAIDGNITLKHLALDNDHITVEGLKRFTPFLCNTTSINATFESNHTLQIRARVVGLVNCLMASFLPSNQTRKATKSKLPKGK